MAGNTHIRASMRKCTCAHTQFKVCAQALNVIFCDLLIFDEWRTHIKLKRRWRSIKDKYKKRFLDVLVEKHKDHLSIKNKITLLFNSNNSVKKLGNQKAKCVFFFHFVVVILSDKLYILL